MEILFWCGNTSWDSSMGRFLLAYASCDTFVIQHEFTVFDAVEKQAAQY